MGDLGLIVRTIADQYLRKRKTNPFQRRALRAIGRGRTAEMGSTQAVCDECGREHIVFRSCRNRSCPRCQAQARAAWLEARERELLPVPYFHVVFTVPDTFNPIAPYCPEVFYAALMRAAGNALLDVGRSKLKAELGCLAVLHTWGQNLSLHPHVHCVVPGGGLSFDRTRWVPLSNPFYLLPVKVLARRFRTLLTQALYVAVRDGKLERLPESVNAMQLISKAGAQEWVVYAKAPFGGPKQVLEYLSAYTHRIAISNSRILSFDGNEVTFRWRDYADGNRMKESTLDGMEFLRRFLMHVLPDRFVRIRYFGLLGNRNRMQRIEHARKLLGCTGVLSFVRETKPRTLCPECQQRLAAPRSRFGLRSPPQRDMPDLIA